MVDGAVVGNGGFVGAPDAADEVEIGFEIAPEHRNRGHATAAARLLFRVAFANGAFRVVAHTLAARNASNAVLERVGMRRLETPPHQEFGSVWRFGVSREQADRHVG